MSKFLIKSLAISAVMVMMFGNAKAQKTVEEFNRKMEQLKAVAAQNNTKLLPDITTQFDINTGILLNWYNQYDLIKSIAIQRSSDSVQNYKTIGYLEKTPEGLGAYLDDQLEMGNNFYRLLIVFSSDLNWYSNISSVFVDSVSFVTFYKNKGQKPPAIKPQDGNNNNNNSNNNTINSAPNFDDPSRPNFMFRPSTVLYYDLFDKQIHLKLDKNWDMYHKYSLKILDPYTKKEIKSINKLPANKLLIDPKNFDQLGYLQFEIYDNDNLIEKGVINIQ